MREEKFYEELSPYVELVKQGDQDTFEYLYQATYDMTKWFVLNFCKDKNEAEDIIQEIYLDVYRYLPDLKNNLAFCVWQRKISAAVSEFPNRRRMLSLETVSLKQSIIWRRRTVSRRKLF